MHIRNYFLFFYAVLFAFGFSMLGTGCKASGNDNAMEYVNKEVSYADGESCVERYLLYEEDGKYERYIAGMYYGKELPGIYFGTLFETGTYVINSNLSSRTVTFWPKKQYSFETKNLEYLGLENQASYSGALTDTTMTITWRVRNGYSYADVPIVYKRK